MMAKAEEKQIEQPQIRSKVRNGGVVYTEDAAGLVPVEVIVRPLVTGHVADKVRDLTDVGFIGKSISDALSIVELEAIVKFFEVYYHLQRIGISPYGETSSSIPKFTDRERFEYKAYVYAYKGLTFAARDFMIGPGGFCALVAYDVGRKRLERQKVAQEVTMLGRGIVNRKDKTRCNSGLVGYLKAVSQVINERYHEYYIICTRRRSEIESEMKRRQLALIAEGLSKKVRMVEETA